MYPIATCFSSPLQHGARLNDDATIVATEDIVPVGEKPLQSSCPEILSKSIPYLEDL